MISSKKGIDLFRPCKQDERKNPLVAITLIAPNYNPWSNTQKNQQKTELQCQDFQIQKPKLK
jgi:hypothetical protein